MHLFQTYTFHLLGLYHYLKLLIQNPDKRKFLGSNGRTQIMTKFNKEKIKNQLDSLYKNILNIKGENRK